MAKIYYVDTAIPADRKKRRKHKTHVVFDGSKVFRVGKLTELEDAGEIYVDALFPELYEEVLELLRGRTKVYLLRDLLNLKKLRMENNLRKSDGNDAMLLARIPKEEFRRLTVEEMRRRIELDVLINRYERLTRRIKILKQWIKNNGQDYGLRNVIGLMTRDKEDVARQIINMVSSNTIYREACRVLGVSNSVELAILVAKLPLHLPLVRLKGLLGFTPNKNEGRYYHKLRGHVTALAVCLYINARKHVSVSEEVTGIANRLPKEKAIYRLGLMILKTLRRAYFMTKVDSLAGG